MLLLSLSVYLQTTFKTKHMKHKIQLVKETKEDGSLVFFIKINDQTKTAHYDFQEAVSKYNYYAELYQPKTEEVLMQIEIDY